MPSKTGVANFSPSSLAAQPKCVSNTCPTFMREGTPSGFKTMSTGVPSVEERHVFFGDDLGDDTFVTVASGHFVTDRELALGGDVNFDRFDDAAVDAFAGFGAFHFFVVLHLQIVEFLFKAADDFVDLVADRRRIDFDAVIDAWRACAAGSW